MPKRLYVIINPKAGTGSDADAEEQVKTALDERKFQYQIKKVKTPDEATRAVKAMEPKDFDALAVYGGDGTVIAVCKAAYPKKLPLLILPGGSANSLAKAMALPQDVGECLDLLAQDTYILRYMGLAEVNGEALLLDLHFGVWAESILETTRASKAKLGQFAYAVSAAKKFAGASKFNYHIKVDGQDRSIPGYALIVANDGFQNVLGVPLFPYQHGRGTVQVAIIRSVTMFSLLSWFVVRATTARNLQRVILTLRTREIEVLAAPDTMMYDDDERSAKLPLKVTTTPNAIMMVAPAGSEHTSFLRRARLWLKLSPYRYGDHLRRVLSGNPSLRYTQIAHNLYLGGQYGRRAEALMRSWGITGVVNMRHGRTPEAFKGMTLLHLPTIDHAAPTIEAFREGVDFIRTRLEAGEGVYIHCRLGEGRGPSMAAAYLISQGMRTQDALAHLTQFRPFARPNRKQVRQLVRWEEEVSRRADEFFE